MSNSGEIRALLVTAEPLMAVVFADLFKEIGIGVQSSANTDSAVKELQLAKYEALVLDFDTIPETLSILRDVHESSSSKNALVFAVATSAAERQRALEQGANFILERPFARPQVKQVLSTAYGLMVRERRRYFRCAAELPVRIVQGGSGKQLSCNTMNISSSGMALSTPCAMNLGETLQMIFLLPNSGLIVSAAGVAVWDDKHGKTGISFRCASPEMQKRLDAWLDDRFYGLPDPGRSAPKLSSSP